MSDTEATVYLIFGGLIALAFALWLGLSLLGLVLMGAMAIGGEFVRYGGAGIVVYIVLWVLAFPVMLVLSIIVGFFRYLAERDADKAR